MYFDAARMGGDGPRYLAKRDGTFRTTTWAENRTAVEEIAAGLLDLGLTPGEGVAIVSGTRPEWMEADLAAMAVGCVTIPIYPSSTLDECAYILHDASVRAAFVENRAQAARVQAAVDKGTDLDGHRVRPTVEHLVVLRGRAPGCLALRELRARGNRRLEKAREEIRRRTGALGREDLATIVYTSGTTGMPKGVPQTHGNHLAALEAIASLEIAVRGEIDFEFLPLAHSFGRMLEYLGIFMGTVTAYAERMATLLDDVARTRPHLVPSVPTVFEKIYAAAKKQRRELDPLRRAVFDWALAVGERRAGYVNRGLAVPAWLQTLDALAYGLVFRDIHERLGGRVRLLVSGGAPLAPRITRFFHAVGLPVLEGYGLTETTPILTINRPGATKIGTVGKAFPGVTLRIAEDGEILAKGPNIAAGYYKRPEETARAWDAEGWFHTGDLGEIDAEGYLRITDRKKELIKTADGKYVAPQKIENLLKARPLISQAVVIGEALEHCVALITLDADVAAALARDHGMEACTPQDLAGLPPVVESLGREVEAVNRDLASHESIRRFRVLDREFTVEGGELTPSLKLRRRLIATRYRAEIESLLRAG